MNAKLLARPHLPTPSRLVRNLPPLLIWFGAAVLGLTQPVITRQPTNLSLSIGASATFRVTATATNGPVIYQWYREDLLLLNATNASLTLTNI